LLLHNCTFEFELVSKLNNLNKKKLTILYSRQSIAKNKQESDKKFLSTKVDVNRSLLDNINRLKLSLIFNIAS